MEIQKEFTTLPNGMRMFHTLDPKRQVDETHEEYKFRRITLKRSIKKYLNPQK